MGRWAGTRARWHHLMVILVASGDLGAPGEWRATTARPRWRLPTAALFTLRSPGGAMSPRFPSTKARGRYRRSRGSPRDVCDARGAAGRTGHRALHRHPEGYSVEVNATTGERNFSASVAEVRNGSGTGVLAMGIINAVANTTFTANVTNLTKMGGTTGSRRQSPTSSPATRWRCSTPRPTPPRRPSCNGTPRRPRSCPRRTGWTWPWLWTHRKGRMRIGSGRSSGVAGEERG